MRYHHTGCLVDSIDESLEIYKKLFPESKSTEKIFISSQSVFVCFLKVADDIYLELIEPVNENSALQKLRNKGTTYYHMGYLVKNIQRSANSLIALNFKMIKTFNSEAFNNKQCSFLMSPEMHLIELIEE